MRSNRFPCCQIDHDQKQQPKGRGEDGQEQSCECAKPFFSDALQGSLNGTLFQIQVFTKVTTQVIIQVFTRVIIRGEPVFTNVRIVTSCILSEGVVYQHEVQNGDLEQGNEDDSFGQRSVTSITLTTTETELAGNQQVQWIPASSWTVYHYNGNSTVADEDAEVEFFTN